MSLGYKHRNWKDEDYIKMVEMYRNGKSKACIGRHFGVSADTIRNRLKELDLTSEVK